jgi:hypothetical protein
MNETRAHFQFKEERQALEDIAELTDSLFVIDKQALESLILKLPLYEILDVPESWLDENNLDLEVLSESEDEDGLNYIGFCNLLPASIQEENLDDYIETTAQHQVQNHEATSTQHQFHQEQAVDASTDRTQPKEVEKVLQDPKKKRGPPKSEKEELEEWLDDVLG